MHPPVRMVRKVPISKEVVFIVAQLSVLACLREHATRPHAHKVAGRSLASTKALLELKKGWAL